MKINHKRIRKCTIICCAFISALLPVHAGTAVNSGAGYTVTTTATKTYISCVATGKMSNGSTAVVTGYVATPGGPVSIGTRSSNTYVYWYISEVSGYSSWIYAIGKAKLSDGKWYKTTVAYAS